MTTKERQSAAANTTTPHEVKQTRQASRYRGPTRNTQLIRLLSCLLSPTIPLHCNFLEADIDR